MVKPNGYLWVACDPKQPGAAFAACIDDGSKEMFRDIADWAKRGGLPKRVKAERGSAMLAKWVRPGRQSRLDMNKERL